MKVFAATARVLEVRPDGRPRLMVLAAPDQGAPTTPVVADWAIPFRYLPQPGDLLQVLGQGQRCWVTGVVHGSGRSQLAFRGDTTLHGGGKLRLGADGGLRLEAPTVQLDSERLETDADAIVQRVAGQDTLVRDTLDERAGEVQRVVDGDDDRLAAVHRTVAERVVKVDGGLLRLS